MNNKYKTGKYLILLFDQHGTKQKTVFADSYTEALKKGRKNTTKPPYASFIVIRVLHNSLDTFNPWGVK